jgi:hypothetical protein
MATIASIMADIVSLSPHEQMILKDYLIKTFIVNLPVLSIFVKALSKKRSRQYGYTPRYWGGSVCGSSFFQV